MLVPDLGEFVAGGPQFVVAVSDSIVMTSPASSSPRQPPWAGRGCSASRYRCSRSSTLNPKLPAMASSTVVAVGAVFAAL